MLPRILPLFYTDGHAGERANSEKNDMRCPHARYHFFDRTEETKQLPTARGDHNHPW